MDVVIAYLYGLLDTKIYVKVTEGLKLLENHKSREMFSVMLKRRLYGLKQFERIGTIILVNIS